MSVVSHEDSFWNRGKKATRKLFKDPITTKAKSGMKQQSCIVSCDSYVTRNLAEQSLPLGGRRGILFALFQHMALQYVQME